VISGSLPSRYARALFEIAREEDAVQSHGEWIEKITGAVTGEPRLLEALSDRAHPRKERFGAVSAISEEFKAPATIQNLLLLLIEKERIEILPELTREYGRLRDELMGIVRVEVRAPKRPTAKLLQKVEAILKEELKKDVVAEGIEEPEIIGGLLLRVGHTVYDGSVRRALQGLRERMVEIPLD